MSQRKKTFEREISQQVISDGYENLLLNFVCPICNDYRSGTRGERLNFTRYIRNYGKCKKCYLSTCKCILVG